MATKGEYVHSPPDALEQLEANLSPEEVELLESMIFLAVLPDDVELDELTRRRLRKLSRRLRRYATA